MLAWKLIRPDHKLGYRDGRELRAGEVLAEPCDEDGEIATAPVLCRAGFHASVNPRDCLKYANGMSHIARVEIGGDIVLGDDKIAGMTIRCLWIADAGKTLHLFAIACRWRQMGYRLRGREPSLAALWALDCAERFVCGETDEEERAAASSAADAAAACAAADDAADDAAYAAYAAADDAAYAAAAAAYAAADDAAYASSAAADDAERLTASQELEAALLVLTPEAA